MDQLIQCPVCTLYLHNGMSLETHLDTHPKDQVIKALCSLTNKSGGSNCTSRTSTPNPSEQSYRSRSRTPVADDKWKSPHQESNIYWRRVPSSKILQPNLVLNSSYIGTPNATTREYQFNNNINDSNRFSGTPYSIVNDKTQQTYASTPPLSEFDQRNVYYNETQEDREIKYSRSENYSPLESTSSVFTHNLPSVSSGMKLHTTMMSAIPRRGNENMVKILPQPNNVYLKTNHTQYITPGVRPIHMVVPNNSSTFVQNNIQNNMFMTSTISGSPMVHNKGPTFVTHPLNQISTSNRINPGTTVVQNSQIIYRETVHNINGKRFITCAPSILSRENVTNVSQATSMYQNVVVLDQMGNSSPMYKTPQRIITKSSPSPLYSNTSSKLPPSTPLNKEEFKDLPTDNKSIIIEVEPVVNFDYDTSITTETDLEHPKSEMQNIISLDREEKSETPVSNKGLKILSNIKVEVPVQHNKSMVNTVMDLTAPMDSEYIERPETPEKKITDIDEKDFEEIVPCAPPCTVSSSESVISNTFSVIKNIGNPHSYKASIVDSKIDIDFSDSCPVPDLICNEKPSISPCSELSDNAENSTSPKPCYSEECFDNVSKNSPTPDTSKHRQISSNIAKYLSKDCDSQKNCIEIDVEINLPKPDGQQKTTDTVNDKPSNKEKTIESNVSKHSPKPSSSKHKSNEINVQKNSLMLSSSKQKSNEINVGKYSPIPSSSKQKSNEIIADKYSYNSSSSKQQSNEINVDKYSPNPSSSKQKSNEINTDKYSPNPSSSNEKSNLINTYEYSPNPSSSKHKSNESNVDKNSHKSTSSNQKIIESNFDNNDRKPQAHHQKPYKHNALRLNNIFVRKNKKVLQIKNAKTFPTPCTSKQKDEELSTCKSIENPISNDCYEKLKSLKLITVEEIKSTGENLHLKSITGEPSVDIKPIVVSAINQPSPLRPNARDIQIKEETNTSNRDVIGHENSKDISISPVNSLQPVSVVSYGNMVPEEFEEESSQKELLDLEGTPSQSKNRQIVSMMNENYFGDNIYADYFSPDKVEFLDSEKDSVGFKKEGRKENTHIWGESSHKESEFVLTDFIHESYKIAENSGADYLDIGSREASASIEEDQDSKVDVLSESRSEGDLSLNICTDECMPPRGELSGQESNGDMESSWSGTYPDQRPPSEPYDLIARESWVSDGSEIDHNEKRENLEEELYSKCAVLPPPPSLPHTCTSCGDQFALARELRSHRLSIHSRPRADYRLLPAGRIKKENKEDKSEDVTGGLPVDSKESLAATILQEYGDEIAEAKPKIEGLVTEEPRQRKRRDYVCPTCKVDMLTEAAFNSHLQLHPLECLTCGKCFFRRANLALHIKTHLGIRNFKCEVCEKRFITKQKLTEHSNIHTGRAPFKCTVCDETFRRYSNMAQHRNRHHFRKKAKVRDFVCQCGAVFHSRAKLSWHRETHEPRPKACLYCSDKFVHAASLTRHVRRAHDACYVPPDARPSVPATAAAAAPRNAACPVCKQVYLRSNMRAHLLTHSGQRPYQCVVCNKAFTTKWNLKLHRWTHMNRSAKPFKCNLCKGAFIRQSEFVAHMNAHKSVKPYTCNYCGCQFIRKYNCQRHVKEHEMAKKYMCKVPECGKSFHRSYYLSEHMKVHSGARPFSCNICGKTSSNKSNHNKHIKIHHAREPVATEA